MRLNDRNQEEFNIEKDPDMPVDAVNSNVIIEEIEMNGKKQKVYRKTYQLIDGRTVAITRMEQMWLDISIKVWLLFIYEKYFKYY